MRLNLGLAILRFLFPPRRTVTSARRNRLQVAFGLALAWREASRNEPLVHALRPDFVYKRDFSGNVSFKWM